MKFGHSLLLIIFLISSAFQQKSSNKAIIAGPEEVLYKLAVSLSAVRPNSQDAYTLYSETAQRLAWRGNYDKADSLFTKANALAVYEKDSLKVLEMNLSKATMYKEEAKYTAALQIYMEALAFYQKTQDVNAQVWVYGYLVEFYRATLNQELCLRFIQEGEELIATNTIDIRPKAYLAHAKSSYILQFRESVNDITFEERRNHMEQGLSMAVASKDLYLIGLNQNALGFFLMHNNPSESEKIIAYFESAKAHMLVNERFRNYTSVLQNFSMFYTRNGQPEMAVDMTFEAIEFSKKNNWNSHLGDLYRLAGEVHYELGLFKESAQYLNEALSTTKASMAKMHSIELGELTTTLEKVITERKLAEQEIETGIAQKQAVDNEKALIATVIISVIVLAIAIISVMLYLRLKGANRSLLSQQEITRKTNAKLENAVEQKTVLYKELNHRVKNNLTILSGLIYLQEDGEKVASQRKLYKTLRQRIQSMALVHQNLYEFDQELNIDFQKYLRQLIPDIAAAFSDDNQVSTNIGCDGLTVDMDEAVPLAMVINELVTNSFKYAFKDQDKGEIQLWSEVGKDHRRIHYKDNGPGMPQEKDTIETEKLGMMLIRLMVEQLKGELIYKGTEGGLYFLIELPPITKVASPLAEQLDSISTVSHV